MVFICPPKEESERRKDVLGKLKTIVDKITDEEGRVPVQMCPPLKQRGCCGGGYLPQQHGCCGEGETSCCSSSPPSTQQVFTSPPDMMVCYKIKKPTKLAEAKKGNNESKSKKDADDTQVKQSKSRELRAGILYSGCDCEKRNGLQDDCQRSECRGSPACLTKPNPTCGPSQFSNGKHLGRKSYKTADSGEGIGGSGAGGGNGNNVMNSSEEYICFPAILDTSHTCPC